MRATDYRQPMKRPFPLQRIRVPLLHIHGSDDYPAVHRMAEKLGVRMRSMHPLSRQLQVQGADHHVGDFGTELTQAASNWLNDLVFTLTPATAP